MVKFLIAVVLVCMSIVSCAETMVFDEDVIRSNLIFSEFIGEISNTDGGLVKDYYEYGRIYEDWEGDTAIDVEEIFYINRYTVQQLILRGYLRTECFNGFLIYLLGDNTDTYAIVRAGLEQSIDAYRVTLGDYETCEIF